MDVAIKLFASARDLFQKEKIDLQVPGGCTLEELGRFIGRDYPGFEKCSGRWAVNLEFKAWDYRLKGGEEIAWIPPVSGG